MNWLRLELGGGDVHTNAHGEYTLTIPAKHSGYANAQIDDTQATRRRDFIWSPPINLSLKARVAPTDPLGTFGFGFWNDPFSLSVGMKGAARKLAVPPQACWFFYASPPNDIQLQPDQVGSGWKAMSLKSPALPGCLTLIPALVAIGMAQLPLVRAPIIKAAQRTLRVAEAILQLPNNDWQSYGITWRADRVLFSVDDRVVLQTHDPPPHPLGFVAWIDNQYAVASPRDGFRFGVIPTPTRQTLNLRDLKITRG